MLYSIVAVLVVILDQAVKNWVSGTLFGTDVVRFIPGVVSLVNVHNDGAAFSFLSGGGARIYFIVITGIFTVAVIIALATNFISGRVSRWSLVMVTAGGLSNCLDRIIYGYVQDMFKVELFDFAIFNVADIFITVFAIVFALAMVFERQEDDEEDEYYDEEEDEEEKSGGKKERKSLLSRFKRDDSLDEDDAPEKGRTADPRRKPASRRSKYEDEYEQYKAEREARQQAEKRSRVKAEPAAQTDPFAEWERASAAVESRRGSSEAAKAMGTKPAPQPVPQPAAKPVPRPVAPEPQAQPVRPVQSAQPVQPPVQPAAQTPGRPAQPKAPGASSDFDLDDILAEFK